MTPPRTLLLLGLVLAAPALVGCGQDASPPVAHQAANQAAVVAETPDPSGLPDDAPLDVGLRREDADVTVTGPAHDVKGISFEDLCEPDPTMWPGPAVDRLVVREVGPEYEQVRELLLYDSPATARGVVQGLRAQVLGCPEAGDRRFVTLRPTGADVLTFGMHYTEGLGGGLWQVTLDGDRLLVVLQVAEWSTDTLADGAPSATAESHQVLDALAGS